MSSPPEPRVGRDLSKADTADLLGLTKSKDAALASDARDELLRREKGNLQPASPALCEALGIRAADLGAAIGQEGKPAEPPPHKPHIPTRTGTALSRQSEADRLRLMEEATKAVTDEAIRTKESVLTVVATYLSNKDFIWWQKTHTEREKEAIFVARTLVQTYNMLEER